eukprot:SAG11_NODE_16367_length_549_cov_1.648889_1_plen_63_part_01
MILRLSTAPTRAYCRGGESALSAAIAAAVAVVYAYVDGDSYLELLDLVHATDLVASTRGLVTL